MSSEPQKEDHESESSEFLAQLGKLVVAWNDLESALGGLIFILAERDPVTAMLLTADMNAATMMNAIRALVIEHDASERRLAGDLAKDSFAKEYLGGPRVVEDAAPYVVHLIDFADRLREYRNFYVHGINSPRAKEGFLARGRTARGRFVFFEQPITLLNLQSLTVSIEACVDYGLKVQTAVVSARGYLRRKDAAPPTWPEKPPLPDKLRRSRQFLPHE